MFATKSKVLLFSILVTLNFTFSGCETQQSSIPFVFVDFPVNINDADFISLNAINNAVYVTGGVKGIILFRESMDEFAAYDRCCSFDPEDPKARVEFDLSTYTATCPVCGSIYSLLLNGSVQGEPAIFPLREYSTAYDPNTGILNVFN